MEKIKRARDIEVDVLLEDFVKVLQDIRKERRIEKPMHKIRLEKGKILAKSKAKRNGD